MFFKKAIKGHKWITFIILVFLALKIATLHLYKEPWWDPAVYIGMGKYIFSLGSAGFWEDARPIAWPIMLGLLWKIGISPIFFGRILDIIFGALVVLLTYKIGDIIFDRKTALIASVFMAFSPTFFFFTGIMITETVSTFFTLLAVYFIITKRNFLSGLFFGIAFMTRFLQIFAFISVVFYILTQQKDKQKILSKLFLGFAIAVLPYFILNAFLYQNPIHPFIYHADLTKNSGWDNYHGISFYFNSLFKENIFYLLSIAGIIYVFKNKDKTKKLVVLPLVIFLAFFISIKQKEMRFLIILMPYMYLLVSSSLISIFNTKNPKTLLISLIIITFVLSFATALNYYKNEYSRTNQYTILQESYDEAKGNLWISSPMIAAYSDNKASNLVYYPYFDSIKEQELENNAGNADYIFIDSCDIGCRPNDSECESKKEELWNYFAIKLKTEHSSKHGQCSQYIFKK